VALINRTKHIHKNQVKRERFSRLLQHPARKCSRSILSTKSPNRLGTAKRKCAKKHKKNPNRR